MTTWLSVASVAVPLLVASFKIVLKPSAGLFETTMVTDGAADDACMSLLVADIS